MRTGSGQRSNSNRTTGSRTAKLYSTRTARKINKIYQNEQANQRRNSSYRSSRNNADIVRSGRYDQYERYDDYYDTPETRKSGLRFKKSTFAVIGIIAVIIALVIILVSVLSKPGDNNIKIAEAETTPEVSESVETPSYEESDPPVIYGVIPIVVYAGHSVAYKSGVYVQDDTDNNPKLEVENEDVDLFTPGTYIVSYIARDKDGNVTREFTTVTVMEGEDLIADEEIYALADRIIDSIITSDMSDARKCLEIYKYLHSIGYVDEVHSEDWMQNAYWMLTLREGDCFCYYSAARLLLTRLGYEVMEVSNNNGYTHYWCLVSTDDGDTWWHFDATCWSWGEDGIVCLVSDNYLTEFTRRHKLSDGRLIHSWDRKNYPASPESDFWDDNERSVVYGGAEAYNAQVYYSETYYGVGAGTDTINTYNYDQSYDYDQYFYDPTFYDYDLVDDTWNTDTWDTGETWTDDTAATWIEETTTTVVDDGWRYINDQWVYVGTEYDNIYVDDVTDTTTWADDTAWYDDTATWETEGEWYDYGDTGIYN